MFFKKFWLIAISFFLYFTNPIRDFLFFSSINQNEGFGTTADSFIIGVARQIFVTIYFSPLALLFLTVGFGFAKKISLYPSLKESYFCWAVPFSLVAFLIGSIEIDNLLYMITRPQHWKVFAFSSIYLFVIYVWWCSGLTIFSNVEYKITQAENGFPEFPNGKKGIN